MRISICDNIKEEFERIHFKVNVYVEDHNVSRETNTYNSAKNFLNSVADEFSNTFILVSESKNEIE